MMDKAKDSPKLANQCIGTTVSANNCLNGLEDSLRYMLMELGGLDEISMKIWLLKIAGFTHGALSEAQNMILAP